ncbi:MAG TPA: hypothetical protein DCM86_20490 [Verrucomicrobiales bacterium]|nr:hypothetical protein [Verrucomicrobiales bacterium]
MKRLLTILVLTELLGVAPRAGAVAFTYESEAELTAPLDADGDGRTDLLLLDRASGVRQLGIQQPNGTLAWRDPSSTGLDRIAWMSVGQFTSGSPAGGFAVAAPDWNEALLFPQVDLPSLRLPTVGIGPNLVTALPFTGGPVEDLAIGTAWEDPPTPGRLAGVALGGGGASLLSGPTPEGVGLVQGNALRFGATGAWVLGAMAPQADGTADFVTRVPSPAGDWSQGPIQAGLPGTTRWAWGEFSAAALPRILLHTPGAQSVSVLGVAEPTPGSFVFLPALSFSLGQGIERIQVIPATGGDLLLAIFQGGVSAASYDFDGTHPPVIRQTFTPPAGLAFSGATPFGSGNMVLLGGSSGGAGRSTAWQRWNRNGAHHSLASAGTLPPIPANAARPDVLLFGGDPKLQEGAPLLGSLRAGDWSLAAQFVGPSLQVTRASWQGSATGLGPSSTGLLPNPLPSPDGLFPEVNQQGPDSSIAFLAPPLSPPVQGLVFSPPAGTYHLPSATPLLVRVTSGMPGTVYVRTSLSDPWSPTDGVTPIELTASTTLYAFLQQEPPGPVGSARYLIVNAPEIQPPPSTDANLNGLPDDWERAFGLSDPNGDADGDGASNLEEYRAGTDPLDPASKPSSTISDVHLLARLPEADAPAGTLCTIAWPATVPGAVLESTPDLTPPVAWSTVGGPFATVGAERVYHQPAATASAERFFRLRYQP